MNGTHQPLLQLNGHGKMQTLEGDSIVGKLSDFMDRSNDSTSLQAENHRPQSGRQVNCRTRSRRPGNSLDITNVGECNMICSSREERRRQRRATLKYRLAHATRERIRVEAFNAAFGRLRTLLPILPPDKKLSKIEILRLATCYISYLNHVLDI